MALIFTYRPRKLWNSSEPVSTASHDAPVLGTRSSELARLDTGAQVTRIGVE